MGGSIVRKYVFKFRGWVLLISLTAASCDDLKAIEKIANKNKKNNIKEETATTTKRP
jgi:hypothetical protein